MATQRFKIKGKTYKFDPNLDKLSLLDIVLFDQQTAEIGLHATWGQVMGWTAEMSAMSSEERMAHPRSVLVLTASMWASRRIGGEAVTFEETIAGFSTLDIEWLTPTEDHRPNPRARKGSQSSPKASAPATPDPEEQGPDPTTPPTLSAVSKSA